MLRIVMDGAGDVPPEWLKQYDIEVVPMPINFGGQVYLQGIDLSTSDFYRLASQSAQIPKTSQPSPQMLIDLYNRIAHPGDTILSIHVSGKLSGTFNSAVIAARDLADRIRVIPFDSGNGSAGMGFMCKEARLLERAGASLDKILDRLSFIRDNTIIVLTLDTLEYARKNGRVPTLQAAVASLLNIKPIVALKDGMLDMVDRVRTRGKAVDCLIDMVKDRVGERLVNVAVVHAEDTISGKSLMEKVRRAINCRELVLTDLSISVAANLGPGTVGIVVYPVEEG